MKVILKDDLENLGEQGDVVDVKPGYARNYLLPRGLAYEASDENLERIEQERQEAEERARRDYLEARRRASQLEDQVLTFSENVGEEGKLFGSVTGSDVADRLNEEGGLDFEVEKRTVLLEEPLKTIGVTMVEIKLHADVVVEVEVRVIRETG